MQDKTVEEKIEDIELGAKIEKLRKSSKTYKEICETLNVTRNVVKAWCQKKNLTCLGTIQRLSKDKFEMMKKLSEKGFSQKEIGKIFNRHESTIGHYLSSIDYYLSSSEREKKRPRKNAKQVRERRHRYKEEIVNLAGGKCVKCGYNACKTALEFHHIDPTNKSSSICRMLQAACGLKRIKEEAKKCILVCANCHREIEYEKTKTV